MNALMVPIKLHGSVLVIISVISGKLKSRQKFRIIRIIYEDL